MNIFGKKVTDTDLETLIGHVLRYGVSTASVIVLAGGIIYLSRHGHELPRYRQFAGEPDTMKKPGLILQAIFRGEGRPLIQAGLLILIATPIARVFISVLGYLVEKDYFYAVLTAIVLLVILWNF
jgi:uncharacterized membrane protein